MMIFDNLCWALSIYTRLNDLDLNSRSQASWEKIFSVFIFLSALSLRVLNICSVIIHNNGSHPSPLSNTEFGELVFS